KRRGRSKAGQEREKEGPCLTTGAFLLPLKHQIRQDSAHKTAIHFNIESLTLATAPNILLN
ncbi:hypothetical protein LLQ54_08200, partial [Rouxiella badensis]|uniref:hypothetical protein n=1 Tax=Rouxiella badensis TaxID=1646377 RepID=UPI001D13B07F